MNLPMILIFLALTAPMAQAANHSRALQDLVAQRTVFRNAGGEDCPEYPALIVMRVKPHGPCQAWERNCRPTDLMFSTWALHEENGALILPWGNNAYQTDLFAKHRFLVRPGLAAGGTVKTVSGCNLNSRASGPCLRTSQRETADIGEYQMREWTQRGRLRLGDSDRTDFSMSFQAASGALTYRETVYDHEVVCRFVPDRTLAVSEEMLAPLQ